MKAQEGGGVKFGGKIDKNTQDGLFAHEEEETYTGDVSEKARTETL